MLKISTLIAAPAMVATCIVAVACGVDGKETARSTDSASTDSTSTGSASTAGETGGESLEACPNPAEPAECPTPGQSGSFVAELVIPNPNTTEYEGSCTVVGTEVGGPTLVELDCEGNNDYATPRALEVDVEPPWTPPPVGTELSVRRENWDFDGNEGTFEVWRLELLDESTLVAAMIHDAAWGPSDKDYEQWALPTELIVDGCLDACEEWHGVWLRMSHAGETVTMFEGDRCDVGGLRVWLEAASGDQCSEPVDLYTELLVLNTSF